MLERLANLLGQLDPSKQKFEFSSQAEFVAELKIFLSANCENFLDLMDYDSFANIRLKTDFAQALHNSVGPK